MTSRILTVETTGGISGVDRVIHVLARFNLDLVSHHPARKAERLAIGLRLNASKRLASPCQARLRAWPCDAHAALEAHPLEERS